MISKIVHFTVPVLTLIVVVFTLNHFLSKKNLPHTPPHQLLEKALREIMITECGIYTLVGSKPLTSIDLFGQSPEEIKLRASFESKKNNPLSFEETFQFTSRWKLWKKWMTHWEKIKPKNSRYLFFRKNHIFGRFANLDLVEKTLSNHYEKFVQVYGSEFNPKIIASEISSEDSKFWNKIENNHYLRGILFGYGEKNAAFYMKSLSGQVNPSHIEEDKAEMRLREYVTHKSLINEKVEINDLPLPTYQSHSTKDEVTERYKQERTYIIDKFQNKDFWKETISLLQSE